VINRIFVRLMKAISFLVSGRECRSNRGEISPLRPEEVEEIKQIFPLDKFFIFGHARSGTTLLTRLIRTHPGVHCNYQGHFFTRKPTIEKLVDSAEIESWFNRPSNRWNHGGDLSPIVLRAVIDFILEREARPLGVTTVGDKSPNNLMNGESVRLMNKFYPDGKLIFLVRDGRDAAISHRLQSFIDATQHLNKQDWDIRKSFERNPEPFMLGKRSIFTSSGIRKAAENWVQNVEETNHIGRELYKEQYISLRYEDLINSSWAQMSRLWSFLSVDTEIDGLRESLEKELKRNPDAKWQLEKGSNLIEPFQKGKIDSWKKLFTQHDINVYKEIAGDSLIKWGYEMDKNW